MFKGTDTMRLLILLGSLVLVMGKPAEHLEPVIDLTSGDAPVY